MRKTTLVVFAAAKLAAQGVNPSPADVAEARIVREMFASSDPAVKSWGAELAGRYQRRDAIPDLVGLLIWTDPRVQEHAIDALIRLRATLSTDTLRQMSAQQRTSAIILSIFNHNVEVLSELQRGPLTDAEWVAVNEGILGRNSPRAYVVDLLKSWTIHVALSVTDSAAANHPGSGVSGGFCGDSFGEPIRTGYPPRAVYRIQSSAEPGDQVLASQPHPVYYRRGATASGCDLAIDRDAYRADFLKLLLNAPLASPALEANLQRNIVWRSSDDYFRQLKQLRDEIDAGFSVIVERLSRRNVIAAGDDAGLKANVDLHITDLRATQQPPLPAAEP